MAVPGKNSFNVGILCSNWVEDRAGASLSKTKPAAYAAAPFATASTGRDFVDHGPAHTAGPAPAPLDRLDGHLVMAHGVDICNRTPAPDHYLTFGQAFFKVIPEAQMLKGPGSVPGNVGRVELIRKKALLRAAGVDAWDVDAVHRGLNRGLPMTAEPPRGAVSLAGVSGAQAEPQQYVSVARRVEADAAVAALVEARPAKSFGRDGVFTKEFAESRPEFQALMKARGKMSTY
jgi:hypothetical protein